MSKAASELGLSGLSVLPYCQQFIAARKSKNESGKRMNKGALPGSQSAEGPSSSLAQLALVGYTRLVFPSSLS